MTTRFYLGMLLVISLAGCASLPLPIPQAQSIAIEGGNETVLGQIALRSLPPGANASGFRLLPEAASALNARMELARQAERSIDAQYYVLEDDPVGMLFLSALRDAARRGVRVRLIVDDLYAGANYALYAALTQEPNFEVRLFNPLPAQGKSLISRLVWSLGEVTRINHRMHNKLFVADNQWAVLGGRNIAAGYFMGDPIANFIDLDLLAGGAIVKELSAGFDMYWNSAEVWDIGSLRTPPESPIDAKAVVEASLARALAATPPERDPDRLGNPSLTRELAHGRVTLVEGMATVLVDTPEKIRRRNPEDRFAGSVSQRTIAELAKAQDEVILVSPYFVPGERGLQALRANAARGVRTVVFTNSLEATDETLVYAGYAQYRRRLLKLGVRIYELGAGLSRRDHDLGDFGSTAGRLHAKVALIDRRSVFIGSMNLDARSSRQNTEVGLIIDSRPLATQIANLSSVRLLGAFEVRLTSDSDLLEWVERNGEGKETVLAEEPGQSWLITLKNWLMTRFVGEDQL